MVEEERASSCSKQNIWSNLAIAFFYLVPVYAGAAVLMPLAFMVCYPFEGTITCCIAFALYSLTFNVSNHSDGGRSWDAVRENDSIWSAFTSYFNANLIPVGELKEEGEKYIFGFHPHGILPFTIFWSTRGALWKKAYGKLKVDVLAASIMFWVPPMREMMMWCGGRNVSQTSFRRALDENRSIVLVPGGQREILHSRIDRDTMTLVKKHKGFVRLAIKHGASLVPVLSFGEEQILGNIDAPAMQSWTRKYVGFGFPLYPHGRWYSPIPMRESVTVVVGHPIPLAQYHDRLHPSTNEPPSDLVDEIHAHYFECLSQLFEDQKASAGFPTMQLIYADS